MRYLLVLSVLLGLVGCSKPDESRIYFVARNVPGANIHSTNLEQALVRHTHNTGGRETDVNMDSAGNLLFTSNRILPEDRQQRSAIGKSGRRRQDLNILYLPAGQLETDTANYAVSVGKTEMPESQAAMSLDGKNIAFVRTNLPDIAATANAAKEREDEKDTPQRAFDELFVMQGIQGEPKKIFQDDVVLAPSWSKVEPKLVFSSYNFTEKRARLMMYDEKAQKLETLLDTPWKGEQIDTPQWSPDGANVSLTSHPMGSGRLRTLYVYNVKSKALKAVSGEKHSVQVPVSWASNSQSLLYGAYIDEGNFAAEKRSKGNPLQAHIFSVNLSGQFSQLTQGEGINVKPTYAPDDSKIAYIHLDEFKARKGTLNVMDIKGKPVATLYDNVLRQSELLWR